MTTVVEEFCRHNRLYFEFGLAGVIKISETAFPQRPFVDILRRMPLSTRANRIHESATFKVAARAAQLRSEGRQILSLGVGEPDFSSPDVAIQAAQHALQEGHTRYAPTAGLPELRQAIATRIEKVYGGPWTADHVTVTVGGKAALFELALALFGSVDEVIVPSPYWVSFPEQIRFCGARMIPVRTDPSERFEVTAEQILGAMSESTRAVILNSPSNPTGAVVAADVLQEIVAECAQRGIVVIADETYDRFVYDGPFPSIAPLASKFPETVVLVGSFSKTYAMTGWRLGYLLANAEISGAVRKIQGHATSAPTTFAMHGALAALESGEQRVARTVEVFRSRRDLLIRRMAAIEGFSCAAPAGAFYCFPHVRSLFSRSISDSNSFCTYLLEEAGVATVPGIGFGADDHIRISFACSEEVLNEGLDLIAQAIQRL